MCYFTERDVFNVNVLGDYEEMTITLSSILISSQQADVGK